MENRRRTIEAELSAVVLAAGLSRRMGGRNKLLLPVAGAPLVRRAVSVVASRPFAEVLVVTGHQAQDVTAAIGDLAVRVVFNPRYEKGQMTSVRAGLAALERPARGVMVCLADQPHLTPDDLETIAGAFFALGQCRVLVPTFRGTRGNPIVLAQPSLREILDRDPNFGCKQFITKNADLVTPFEMPNDHVLMDVDHPGDYQSMLDGAVQGDG